MKWYIVCALEGRRGVIASLSVDVKWRYLFTAAAYWLIVAAAHPLQRMNLITVSVGVVELPPFKSVTWAGEREFVIRM